MIQDERLNELDYLFSHRRCAKFTSSMEQGDAGRLPLLSAIGVS